jgi:beta-phosphoglucomutase
LSQPGLTPGAQAGSGSRAVVFDFDGVLADTERLHLLAFQDAFVLQGWTLDERAYYDRYMGFDDRGAIVEYARDFGFTLAEPQIALLTSSKASAFAARLASADVLFPGTPACVTRLASAFPLAIASGALHDEIVTILSAGGLLDYFPVIVGADDCTAHKPDPEPYLRAAAALGVAPARCTAVEDSSWGLASARAAGMRTVGVTTTSPREALRDADVIITGLHELTASLV